MTTKSKIEGLNGIIGVVNTPFTSNDEIDCDSLRRYVHHSIQCGVVGFLALGMAAEINKLSVAEKELIVKTIISEVNGRVPVICGISTNTQNERLSLAEKWISLGCQGIMVSIPYEDDTGYSEKIFQIADLKPGFLMIQDWEFHGYGLPVNLIKRLYSEVDVFRCLKIEVIPAGVKYSEIIKATDGKLHVSGGWAGTQMIEALDRGVDAFMPTILHDIYVNIYNLHRSGKREDAKKIFYELVPILAFSHQHLDISIHFNKRIVHRQGIFSTDNVREPILPFDAYHEKVAHELILKAKNISDSVKSYV
jgi:dihydrodipicolinate synthase/N-acetylneuraminate lyase